MVPKLPAVLRGVAMVCIALVCGICALFFNPAQSFAAKPNVLISVVVALVVAVSAYCMPLELFTPTADAARMMSIIAMCSSMVALWVESRIYYFPVKYVLLFAGLIVGGFLHELLRKDRAELIKSLSMTVFMGFSGLMATGWITVPYTTLYFTNAGIAQFLPHIVAASAVAIIVICAHLAFWSRDYDRLRAHEESVGASGLSIFDKAFVGYVLLGVALSGSIPLIGSMWSSIHIPA